MKSHQTKMIYIIAVAALALSACGGGGDSLEGRWELTNEDAFFGEEEEFLAEDGGEFFDADVYFIFGNSGELLVEVPLFIDYAGLFSSSGLDASIEIVAEPLNMLLSFSGTYEQLSGDIVQLELDPDSVTYSPDEYCFSIGGEETCQDLFEVTEDFEASDFDLGTGNYEVVDSTLTIWDDDCDYPSDQTCTMVFTKVE